jgi:hypothetical protein
VSDRKLVTWFRNGGEAHGEAIAYAEERLAAVLGAAGVTPSSSEVQAVRSAAKALLNAVEGGLAWLAQKPSSNAAVNVGMRRSWKAYASAASTILAMVDGGEAMTAESGAKARALIVAAQKENSEFTKAFKVTVLQ